MKDHLIGKNVAADIAVKLCESVSAKLEGKVLGTFGSIATTVKTTLQVWQWSYFYLSVISYCFYYQSISVISYYFCY